MDIFIFGQLAVDNRYTSMPNCEKFAVTCGRSEFFS